VLRAEGVVNETTPAPAPAKKRAKKRRSDCIDLAGRRFGLWFVTGDAIRRFSNTHWKCRCDCGAERYINAARLRSGASTGCRACVRRVAWSGAKNNPARFSDLLSPEPNTGCWLFTLAGGNQFGHGLISIDNEPRGAHRYAWEIANGAIPDGLEVLHRCDVPACCNPTHLFLGTQADNMRDASRKGRLRRRAA
jgi:hypothetical protein